MRDWMRKPGVYVDTDEKITLFREELDDRVDLGPLAPRDWSVDFAIVWSPTNILTFERKDWETDFVPSFHEGKLDRQISYADCLIVERSQFFDPEEGRYDASVYEAARKHFWHIESQMWATMRSDPFDTIDYLRYIESKEGDLEVRQNLVVPDHDSLRERLIACMPGVNPRTELGDESGRTKGEAISELVNWEHVADALHLIEWQSIYGIGQTTVENTYKELTGDELVQ